MATTSVTAGAPPVRPSRRKSAQRGGLIAWTFALPALAVYFVFLVYPAMHVAVLQLHRLGRPQRHLQPRRRGQLRQHGGRPGRHPGDGQQPDLDRGHHHRAGDHRAAAGHRSERQGQGQAGSPAAVLHPGGAAAGRGRLDLGLAVQPAVRRHQRRPAGHRSGLSGPAMARSGLDRPGGGDRAGHLAARRLPDAALPSRPAGDLRRHVRGGHRRRRHQARSSSGTSPCPACGPPTTS